MNALSEIYKSGCDVSLSMFSNNKKEEKNAYERLEDIPDELDIKQDPKTVQSIMDLTALFALKIKKQSNHHAVKIERRKEGNKKINVKQDVIVDKEEKQIDKTR